MFRLGADSSERRHDGAGQANGGNTPDAGGITAVVCAETIQATWQWQSWADSLCVVGFPTRQQAMAQEFFGESGRVTTGLAGAKGAKASDMTAIRSGTTLMDTIYARRGRCQTGPKSCQSRGGILPLVVRGCAARCRLYFLSPDTPFGQRKKSQPTRIKTGSKTGRLNLST